MTLTEDVSATSVDKRSAKKGRANSVDLFIGKRVSELRRSMKISQEVLARSINVSP